MEDMRVLLDTIDELLARWEKNAPVERRGRSRAPQPPEKMVAADVMASGMLSGVALPTLTPRGMAEARAEAKGGSSAASSAAAGGATPRNRQLFLHNPKLLTAQGGLKVRAELA
eukprot:gene1501-6419_t